MKTEFECKIFKIVSEDYDNKSFVRLISNDWVNIIGFNEKNELLLIPQYRHGIKDTCVETPGGIVDLGEENNILDAAKREFLEETGYESNQWTKLGSVDANPAYQNNKCHYYLAENIKKVSEPKLDDGEYIGEPVFQDLKTVYENIRLGKITHAIVIAGLHLYALNRG